MELFSKMTNILNENQEELLKQAIEKVKQELKDLTPERTCKIYNNYLYQEIIKRHINAKLINTLDLNCTYEHQFVLLSIYKNGESTFFLADLTFSQFVKEANIFSDLLTNGYQKVDDFMFNQYLSIVLNKEYTSFLLLEDVYFDMEKQDYGRKN